jgi:hypothetical protein
MLSEKEIKDIKGCPFCGGTPEIITIGNEFTKKRSVEIKCTSCYTKQITGAIRNSIDWCTKTAIEKWNKRVPDIAGATSERERVKVLVDALTNISEQHTCKDMIANGLDDFGDIEYGYDAIIDEARESLTTYNQK